jgi:Lantibiotic dehydratase, N terminus
MEPDYELAELGVVRGAAWPIECLDRFGSQELVELALSSADRDHQLYFAKYAEIFDREREILWEITAADDRFAKALMLSNRLVADKVRAYLPRWQQQPRNKIIRRLEQTLYRYLARAVGRTTPNGLWAGVCLFTPGDRSECVKTAAEYAFAPDLRPFQSILRCLGDRAIYRSSSYWRANPTLRHGDGTWQFWSRSSTEAAGWCQIAGNESIDRCLQTIIDLPPLLWSEIVTKIDLLTPIETGEWLDRLIDVGAIVGGLDLPVRFDTVWDGLVESGEKLIGTDRDLWDQTLDRLTFLCFDLSVSWDEIDSPRLSVYLDEARQAISDLIIGLAIPIDQIELPDLILHCDLLLPWQITIDRDRVDRLATTIAIYDRDWLDRTSPSMQFRRQQRAYLQAQLTKSVELNSIEFTNLLPTDHEQIESGGSHFYAEVDPPHPKSLSLRERDFESGSLLPQGAAFLFSWGRGSANGGSPRIKKRQDEGLGMRANNLRAKSGMLPIESMMNDPEMVDCLQKWTELLNQSTDRVYLKPQQPQIDNKIATAPLGCFYFTPVSDWQLIISGIDDDPARAFTRFGELLDADNRLHNWLRQKLSEISVENQIDIVEIQTHFEGNPNPLARSQIVAKTIDLWGADPNSLSLKSAQITLDQTTKMPLLSIPLRSRPIAIFFFCAANIGAIDPLVSLLLYTGFQERSSYFKSIEMLINTDLKTIHTPRIILENDEIVRPNQTILNQELLQQMIGLSPRDRYLRWQEMARDFGWSNFLNIRVDREPSLLIKSDSPLALEAVFKSIKPHTKLAIVEEIIELPWLVDRAGQHYFAEFAMPFQRAKHGWSDC